MHWVHRDNNFSEADRNDLKNSYVWGYKIDKVNVIFENRVCAGKESQKHTLVQRRENPFSYGEGSRNAGMWAVPQQLVSVRWAETVRQHSMQRKNLMQYTEVGKWSTCLEKGKYIVWFSVIYIVSHCSLLSFPSWFLFCHTIIKCYQSYVLGLLLTPYAL